MKKYIITGVTSFLGSNLAKCLIADGNEVYGIVRPESKNTAAIDSIEGLNVIRIDLDSYENDELLCDAIKSSGVSGINGWIHFSWDGIGSEGRSNPEIQKRNIINAKKSYHAAKKLGAGRFVFSGSQAEYGNGTKDKPNPKSQYGIAKLEFGDWAKAQQTGMEFVHLRIYSVYGPGDHETSLVNSCVRTFLKKEDMILGPCSQLWNFMDIRDCSKAIAMIVEREESTSGVFEIASEHGKQLSEYVKDIWKICGENGECLFGQRANNAEGAADLVADFTKLKEIGFSESYTFEEGVRNLIDFVSKK